MSQIILLPTTDEITTSCSAVVYGTEGKKLVKINNDLDFTLLVSCSRLHESFASNFFWNHSDTTVH